MGNTYRCRRFTGVNSVHPHTHGEHISHRRRGLNYIGSSPHAWGTLAESAAATSGYRFIPTRMGNTNTQYFAPYLLSVHPHTHGEHSIGRVPGKARCGSSPHAWGTPGNGAYTRPQFRFIPTRMGNTRQHLPQRTRLPVHPHTHGEHTAWLAHN